jgi:hypothetical protein
MTTAEKKAAAKRIYVVTEEGKNEQHLVRASSQAQAVHHVVAARFCAEVASQSQLVQLLGDGVKVEEAGSDA